MRDRRSSSYSLHSTDSPRLDSSCRPDTSSDTGQTSPEPFWLREHADRSGPQSLAYYPRADILGSWRPRHENANFAVAAAAGYAGRSRQDSNHPANRDISTFLPPWVHPGGGTQCAYLVASGTFGRRRGCSRSSIRGPTTGERARLGRVDRRAVARFRDRLSRLARAARPRLLRLLDRSERFH